MSAADRIRAALEGIDRDEIHGGWWETSVGVDFGTRQKATILAALDELEAELATLQRKLVEADELTYRNGKRAVAAEAELERLTVGRATLEDQTNRAELAEARAEDAERKIRDALHWLKESGDESYLITEAVGELYHALFALGVSDVLSGGSE